MGDSYTKLPPVTISGLPRVGAASVTDLIEVSTGGSTMSASLGQVVQLSTTAFTTMALDIFLPLTGGTLSGPLHGTTATFSSAPAYPDNSTSVATTSFVMSAVTAGGSGYLPLTGGTLSGDLFVSLTGTVGPANSGVHIYKEGWIDVVGSVGWSGLQFTQRSAPANQKIWNFSAGVGGEYTFAAYADDSSTLQNKWTLGRDGSLTLPGPLIYNALANPFGKKKFQTSVAPDGNFLLQSLTDAGAPQFTWAFKRDVRAGYTSIPGWLQIEPPLNTGSPDPLLQESPIVSFYSPAAAVDHKWWHLWASSTNPDLFMLEATADDLATSSALWTFNRVNGATVLPGSLTGTTAAFSGEISAATPVLADNDTTVATTAWVKSQGYSTGGGAFLPLTGGTLSGPLIGTTAVFNNGGDFTLRRTGTDGGIGVLFSGVTKGIRFGNNPATSSIEGVDNTGAGSFQPLAIGGSVVNIIAPLTGTAATFSGAVGIGGALTGASATLTGDLTISKDQPVLFLTDTNNAVDQKYVRFWQFNDGNIYLSFLTDASALQNQFQWTRNGEFISPFNVHVALNGSGIGYYIGGSARLVDELTNYTAIRAPGTSVNRLTVGNDVNPTNYYTNDVHAIRDRALTNIMVLNGTTAAFSVGVTGTAATFTGIVTGGTLANTADVNGYALSAGRYSVGFGKAALNTQGAYGWAFQVNGVGMLEIDAGGATVFGPFNATGGVSTNGVAVGYLNVPQNIQATTYAPVLADSGKHIYHAVAAATATWTIPANGTVAYPIGTTLTFVNDSANNITIAITTDTLVWSPGTTTGSRTLGVGGIATALKVTATRWLISGTGLT